MDKSPLRQVFFLHSVRAKFYFILFLLITRMITDRIGLHSVLLPLLIRQFFTILQENLHSFNIHDDQSTRFLCTTNYSIEL